MILVDTSIWADHFRRPDDQLVRLIRNREILMHPFVLGELAVGNLRNWEGTLLMLAGLPRLEPVSEADWIAYARERQVPGTGIGFVDVHLLAAAERAAGVKLWSRDKRLAARADRLGFGWSPES